MYDATNPITHLSEEECWARLDQKEFGRLAYHLTDEVHIVPLNYAVDDGRIVYRTAEGSKLLGMMMNADVAFEIDNVDNATDTAWSVIARGRAVLLEGAEARATDNLRLRPWVPTQKFNVIAIKVTEITGREFALARPWRQMMPQN